MTFRLFVCALLAPLTMSLVTPVAYSKTEAECLEAIKVGNRLISENPKNYRGYASRGSAYEYLKKYDLAEKDLLMAISLNPSFSSLYIHLASVYNETKRYEKAAVASRKAVDLGAEFQESYDALLSNLCMSRHFEECVKKCDEVLVKFPADPAAFFYRAMSKNSLSSFAKSEVVSDLAKAHSLAPLDEELTRFYGWAQEGKFQKLKCR